MPNIGDADDGRLVIATGYGTFAPGDGTHILGPAGHALEESAWIDLGRRLGSDTLAWESFWWGYPPAAADCGPRTAATTTARLFPHAGIAVGRCLENGGYLLVSNAVVGTNGFGNHKHNDLLSFEYHDRGSPLIVDPGSYVYTSDFAARNAFRSTSRHNTIMLDGVEQNEFREEWLFRMFAKATPTHLRFEAADGAMIYEGSHDGYVGQLPAGVTHTRRFRHETASGRLEIADTLSGAGSHEAVWHFHLDPAVEPKLEPGGAVVLEAAGRRWRLAWSEPRLAASLVPSAVSPSYGISHPTKALRLASRITLDKPFRVVLDLSRMEQST